MHAAVSRHTVSRGWEASFARKVLKERFRRCLHGSRSGQSSVVRRGAKGRVPSRFGATALRGVVVESSMSSPTRKYWGQQAG